MHLCLELFNAVLEKDKENFIKIKIALNFNPFIERNATTKFKEKLNVNDGSINLTIDEMIKEMENMFK